MDSTISMIPKDQETKVLQFGTNEKFATKPKINIKKKSLIANKNDRNKIEF